MRGGDKLLEQIDGTPQLARIAKAALTTGCPVAVALPRSHPNRAACLAGLAVQSVTVPNPEDGMAASLTAGLGALPASAAVLLLLRNQVFDAACAAAAAAAAAVAVGLTCR